MSVPYITEPPWAKWAQLVALTTRYLCLVLTGMLALDVDGYSPLLQVAGALVAVSSAVAAIGVLRRQYRIEWVSLSPMVVGLLWVAVLIGHGADFVVTVLVVSLAVAQVDRLVHLTRVAAKLRALPR